MNTHFKVLMISSAIFLALVPHQPLANDKNSEADADEPVLLITATRLARAPEEVAGTVTHIDSEELKQQLAEDMDDIVRYQPGLSMKRVARGGNQGFSIRGMSGKRVLMLLDGIKSSDIYPAGTASYGNDNYEIDDLKNVEIIRGPASALYGADALGGVVLMSSKDPVDYVKDDKEIYLRLNASSASANNLNKFGFTAAGINNDWQYMVQVTRRNFEETEVKGNGFQTPQEGESTAALIKLVYQPSENNIWTATVDNFDQNVEYNLTNNETPELFYTGLDDAQRQRFGLSHQWNIGSKLADKIESTLFIQTGDALQNTVQLRTNSFSFPSTPFGSGNLTQRVSDFEFNQDVSGITSNLTKVIESKNVQQTLVYGVSYEEIKTERPRNRCETDTVTNEQSCAIASYPMAPPEVFPNKTFPDTDTTRIGVYFQDEIVFGDSGFTVIPGVRFDQFKMTANSTNLQSIIDLGFEVKSTKESEVSKNLGVIYELTKDSSIFFQYAEGFRAPSYDEANQAFVNLGHGYAIVPNPNLNPETSQGYEIGYKSSRKSHMLSFAVYQNNFKDFIASHWIGEENGINLYQDSNLGDVQIKGAELNSIWNLSNHWTLRGAIAYSEGTDKTDATDLNQIEPLTTVIGVNYSQDAWRLSLNSTLVGSKTKVAEDDDVTADSYQIFDLNGYYDFSESLNIRFAMLNLFDKEYANWANIQGLNEDSNSIANLQQPGREFRASLTWEFQ